MKNTKVCSQCGQAVNADTAYCSGCGAKLRQMTADFPPEVHEASFNKSVLKGERFYEEIHNEVTECSVHHRDAVEPAPRPGSGGRQGSGHRDSHNAGLHNQTPERNGFENGELYRYMGDQQGGRSDCIGDPGNQPPDRPDRLEATQNADGHFRYHHAELSDRKHAGFGQRTEHLPHHCRNSGRDQGRQ